MKMMERPKQNNHQWFAVITLFGTLVLSLPLLACTSAQNANAKATMPKVTTAETTSLKSNKLDACALLSKSEVERILGQSVTAADSGRAMEGTATMAAFSQCAYKIAAAQTVELFARRSPINDNTPEAIQRVRDTMKEITQKEPLEVAGIGDTAFWTASRQLHVFAQGNLYFYVAMMNFKDEADAKAKASELARQALLNLR